MEVKIYCLYDPETCKIRYIGRTTKKILTHRLIEHICKAKYYENYYPNKKLPHKVNWIKSLLNKGIEPKIKYLTFIKGWSESHNFERELIKKYKSKLDLTNSDDRGEGSKNRIVDLNTKQDISNSLKKYYQKNINNKAKSIEVFDLKGNFISEFPSILYCCKVLKLEENNIGFCLKGKFKQLQGYQFRYKGENKNMSNYVKTKKPTLSYPKIEVIDIVNNTNQIFSNMMTVDKKLNFPKNTTSTYIKNNSKTPYKRKYIFRKIV